LTTLILKKDMIELHNRSCVGEIISVWTVCISLTDTFFTCMYFCVLFMCVISFAAAVHNNKFYNNSTIGGAL